MKPLKFTGTVRRLPNGKSHCTIQSQLHVGITSEAVGETRKEATDEALRAFYACLEAR